MLLASPHTQRRYLVALYVPALLLTAMLPQMRDEIDRRLAMFGLVAVLATGTVLPLLFGGRHLALWYEAGSPYFFGTLAMFVTLLALRARLQKRPQAASAA
jgi:Na+/melibiose symporter-like transporter